MELLEFWLGIAKTIPFVYWLPPMAAMLYMTINVLGLMRLIMPKVRMWLLLAVIALFLFGEFPPLPFSMEARSLLIMPTMIFGIFGIVAHFAVIVTRFAKEKE